MPSFTRRQLASLAFAPVAAAVARKAPRIGAQSATPVPSGRPNIILIVTDDLDNRNAAAMPNVQALLAAQGANCKRNFVTTPLCAPSRASLFRGQYAHNHGVLTNASDQGGFPAFHALGLEASTLPLWLHGAGYQTGLFGKYLNRYPKGARKHWIPPGWDTWAALLDSGSNYYTDFSLNENGAAVAYSSDTGDYLTDVLSDKAAAFVRACAGSDASFFAYVAPYAPHTPATPAPRVPAFNEADVSDKPTWLRDHPLLTSEQIDNIDEHERQRLRALLAVDDLVANLVGVLTETDLLDRTYVLFTSDNGFLLGEHRLPLGKQTAYEESIGVPLIVRGPDIPAASTIDAITLNIDLAPTIAEWCGVAAPAFVDGLSLATLLRGTTPADWRHVALIEEFDSGRNEDAAQSAAGTPVPEDASDEADASDITPASPPAYHALRGDDLLYVAYDDGERELYDLAADPYELTNIAESADPATLARLSATVAALSSCQAETCRAITATGDGGDTPLLRSSRRA